MNAASGRMVPRTLANDWIGRDVAIHMRSAPPIYDATILTADTQWLLIGGGWHGRRLINIAEVVEIYEFVDETPHAPDPDRPPF